jgi:homoserine kinase
MKGYGCDISGSGPVVVLVKSQRQQSSAQSAEQAHQSDCLCLYSVKPLPMFVLM